MRFWFGVWHFGEIRPHYSLRGFDFHFELKQVLIVVFFEFQIIDLAIELHVFLYDVAGWLYFILRYFLSHFLWILSNYAIYGRFSVLLLWTGLFQVIREEERFWLFDGLEIWFEAYFRYWWFHNHWCLRLLFLRRGLPCNNFLFRLLHPLWWRLKMFIRIYFSLQLLLYGLPRLLQLLGGPNRWCRLPSIIIVIDLWLWVGVTLVFGGFHRFRPVFKPLGRVLADHQRLLGSEVGCKVLLLAFQHQFHVRRASPLIQCLTMTVVQIHRVGVGPLLSGNRSHLRLVRNGCWSAPRCWGCRCRRLLLRWLRLHHLLDGGGTRSGLDLVVLLLLKHSDLLHHELHESLLLQHLLRQLVVQDTLILRR